MTDISNGSNTHNGHGFVDLGLPSGTLWATCNVGATSPEQAGLYFAFGETKGFTAEQVTSGVRAFYKDSYNEGPAASIFTDLTLEQDAAHVCMGGKWRMPTKDEWRELIDNTTSTWVSNYMGKGIKGQLFTSKVNGNSIFFPAVGYCIYSSVNDVDSRGYYWSSSWKSSSYAWRLYFNSWYQNLYYNLRYWGQPVRGVYKG